MPRLQRYVSRELTHFVGKSESDDEARYFLLVEKILKPGLLTNPNHRDGLTVHPKRISENEMYDPMMVCFCDIPLDDIDVHMGKYSRFGLSFLKPFLVQKGACPVFYVAKNSSVKIKVDNSSGIQEIETQLGKYFDGMAEENEILNITTRFGESALNNDLSNEQLKLLRVQSFLDFRVFSFAKFFDENKSDDDPDNFYMEREWRVLGHVEFQISDVYRVILPQSFAKRFRKEVPDYFGQITFADSPSILSFGESQ